LNLERLKTEHLTKKQEIYTPCYLLNYSSQVSILAVGSAGDPNASYKGKDWLTQRSSVYQAKLASQL